MALSGSLEEKDGSGDGELVARMIAGDERAFERIYERRWRRAYLDARKVLDDHHEAEDAAQDVFLKLLTDASNLRNNGERLAGWLAAASTNKAVDRRRKADRSPLVADVSELPPSRLPIHVDSLPGSLESGNRPDLLPYIRRLPRLQKQVILLHFFADLSILEVAHKLGRTPAVIRQTKYRALKILEERLSGRT